MTGRERILSLVSTAATGLLDEEPGIREAVAAGEVTITEMADHFRETLIEILLQLP